MNKLKCIECGEPAVYVRCTQFAGKHPYCEECVKNEKDFYSEEESSYYFWYTITDNDDE